MPKNNVVRIKRRLSRDQTQEVSVARSLEAKPVKKALFPTNPPQDQTRFPSITSINGEGDYQSDRVTSYSFDGWIYSSKALRCSCSCAGISSMCKHWEEFLLTSTRRTWFSVRKRLYRCGQFLY